MLDQCIMQEINSLASSEERGHVDSIVFQELIIVLAHVEQSHVIIDGVYFSYHHQNLPNIFYLFSC